MSAVSVYDARAGLLRLIDRALTGEDVVITRKGKPVVRLVPVEEPPARRRLGVLAGEFDISDEALLEPLPDDILDAFYGESDPVPEEPREERALKEA